MRNFILPVVAVLVAVFAGGPSWAEGRDPAAPGEQGKFALTCLEIPDIQRGAGLALVLQTPGGHTWLYDTGSGYPDKEGWTSDYNAGRDTVMPFLKARGITSLDGVIISHAHYDHFGGLLWLVDNLPIAVLYDPGYGFQGASSADYNRELADYDKLRSRFKAQGKLREVQAGDRLTLDDRLEVEAIAPPKEFFKDLHPERRPKNDPAAHYMLNSNSLELRIRHGELVFLLAGDIEADDQVHSLLPSVKPEMLKCNVLVAPGHGLHAPREFAESTRPELTLVSLFDRWGKGCPARKVFADVGSRVLVTGLHGRITVVSDGKSFATDIQRPGG
jgi:competence protein ComEC